MTARLWWALLLLSLAVVAGRTLLAAQAALRPAASLENPPVGRGRVSPAGESARVDSILAAVSVPPRNPFAAPPAPAAPARGRTPAVQPVEAPPRVVLLMQDGGGTIVQVEVNGETSPRMTVGSTFRGWTVQAITGSGVTVVKGNRQHVLPRP